MERLFPRSDDRALLKVFFAEPRDRTDAVRDGRGTRKRSRQVDNPFHDTDVTVTSCGRICMHRKKINISVVMAGQKVGIQESMTAFSRQLHAL
nr:hypothetical protein [Rhizobium glycinendophyticum]